MNFKVGDRVILIDNAENREYINKVKAVNLDLHTTYVVRYVSNPYKYIGFEQDKRPNHYASRFMLFADPIDVLIEEVGK